MNVLSLFDGISCGQVALKRLGCNFNMGGGNYYASEINPHSIAITQHNFPNTIQLGDVNDYNEWELPTIDLLIGGSPCQNISNLNKKHEGLQGEKSSLFYKYLGALHKFKPKYFLLENVVGHKKSIEEITKELGVEPIKINSSLVSAQNRVRYYWTNIPVVGLPEDKNILLKDILQPMSECQDYVLKDNQLRWLLSDKGQQTVKKGYACINGMANGKARTLTRRSRPSWNCNYVYEDGKYRFLTEIEYERLQTLDDNYTKTPNVPSMKRYEAIGDGWTVDVIAWILGFME